MLMVSVGSRSGWACSGRRRNRVVTLARARGEVPVNEITWKSPSSVLSDITSDTTMSPQLRLAHAVPSGE
jgi:hypothetical protein